MNGQIVGSESFFDISKSIVEKFIQSVVAVDDGMVFDNRPIPEIDEILVEPDDNMGIGITPATGGRDEPVLAPRVHHLYYQELSSSFAKKGIICSGFKPLSDFSVTAESILESSKNADITILDWQMEGGENPGTLALAAIHKIIDSDISEGGRLRLITIYTAENIDGVLERLCSSLSDFGCEVQNANHVRFSKEQLRFCKIDVIGKEHSETELTDQVIESLTSLTVGVLSNAVLSSITETRNKTHNILYKFNKELDPAYLSHVLGLISSPDMREQAHEVAFDYAVDLISEEIKSELQISSLVKASLSQNSLKLWPEYVNSNDSDDFFGLIVGDLDEVKLDTSRVSGLLTVETEKELEENLKKEPQIAKVEDEKITSLKLFKDSGIQLTAGNDSTSQHLELSSIQNVRRDVKTNEIEHPPVMKQGTVIKQGKHYFVCIQPLCDSVRLKENTNFTFLRISKVNGRKSFTHVMRNDDSYVKLCIDPSSKKINVFQFKPCSECRMIKANLSGKDFIFKDENTNNFIWCGEFKQAVSQEIANAVSASMARVGLDSFEWLRLKSKLR